MMNLEYINRTTSAKNCCKSIDLSLTSSERQREDVLWCRIGLYKPKQQTSKNHKPKLY